MKSYREIEQESALKLSALIKECGVFFAFSKEQFDQNKTPLKDGEKYVSIEGGGYLPKGNVQAFLDGQEAISKWETEAIKQNNAKDAHIAYELSNYECYYTGDISRALAILPYTEEDVLRVYLSKRADWAASNG